ncbi:MAG: hypothetical protein L6R40_004754 [Gallowayella cf. fulva]|nr:MAG: hypothetical protein L6R40_004754 [Xanthomendoza cf. fulva]
MLPPANYRQSPVSEKSAQALRENRSVKDKSSGPGLISAAHLSNQQDDPRVNTTAPEAEALIDFSDDSDDSEVPVGGGKEKSKIPDPRGAPAIYYDVGIFYPPLKPHFTRPPSSGTSVQGGISEVQDLQVCTQRNDDSADHISVVSLDGCQVPGASAIQLRDDRASRDGREVRIWQEANKMDEAGSVLPPEAVQSRMPPEEVEHFDSRERVGGTVRVRLPGMPRTLLIGLDEPDGHPVNSDEPERYPISFIDHDDPSANDPHAQKPNDNYNNLKDLNTQNNTDSRLDKVDISDDEDLMTFDTHPIPPLKAALTTNPDNIPSSSTPFPQTQHPNKRLARTHIYRQQKQTAERELQRGQASPTTTDTKDYQNELQSLQEPAFATPTIVPPAKPTTDGAQEEDSVPRYKKTRRGLRKKKQLMDSEVARREGSAVEGGSPEMEAKGEYGEEVEGDGREEPNV